MYDKLSYCFAETEYRYKVSVNIPNNRFGRVIYSFVLAGCRHSVVAQCDFAVFIVYKIALLVDKTVS